MTFPESEIIAVASRAQDRYPGLSLDIAFPICLPVYELRLRVTEMGEHELSTASRFVLQLVSLKVSQPDEIGKMLGISKSYVAHTATELLRESMVVQRPDKALEITEVGREALTTGGRSFRPRNRHPKIPYDPLTKSVVDLDIDQLLDRTVVRKNGLFVVPTSPRKPRLSAIRLDDVRAYDSHTRRQTMTEILDINDIKDSKLRYRDDIILAKLDGPDSDKSTYAAYRAQQYMDDISGALQRLADRGTDLVPDELKTDSQWAVTSSVSASSQELIIVSDIDELHSEVVAKARAVEEAKVTRGTTQSSKERALLAERIEGLERDKERLEGKLAQREGELSELTKGETKLLRTEEHRHYLLKAINNAKKELILVSAWVNPYAFDDEICRQLVAAIGRGVNVRIAWGLGITGRRRDGARNRINGDSAIGNLRRLIPRNQRQQLVVKLTETHEKFIICDDQFCAWGSFNWLSYRGERDSGYRRETSYYSERRDDIALWKNNAESLFGG